MKNKPTFIEKTLEEFRELWGTDLYIQKKEPKLHWVSCNKELESFLITVIAQAEKIGMEKGIEKIKKEYDRRYQQIAKENGVERKTPHTIFHDILSELKAKEERE